MKIVGSGWSDFKTKGKFLIKQDKDGDNMWLHNEVTKYKDDLLIDTAKVEKGSAVSEEECTSMINY